MIYLAPLQGFTDFVYRSAYARAFTGVDAYFIPYITLKNQTIPKKYIKEISKSNNPQQRVIPQVLAKNGEEMHVMGGVLEAEGFKEINLNLGCPYPMVTNRGKGAGLLQKPQEIAAIIESHYKSSKLDLSVKLRVGLEDEKEIEAVLPVLNAYPLKELIVHPRTAKQMYGGQLCDSAFRYVMNNTNHLLCLNGDICTVQDLKKRKEQFPEVKNWMIGRGLLMNPLLPAECSGKLFSKEERKEKIVAFHKLILEAYMETMDNDGNALNKMKQFWFYFSYSFPNPKKAMKGIKKARNLSKFLAEVQNIFASF